MRKLEAKKAKGVNTKAMVAASKPKDEIDAVIQAFLRGDTEGNYGRYWIHGDIMVYKTAVTEEINSLRPHFGINDKNAINQAISTLSAMLLRADQLQIDLVSHSKEQIKTYIESLGNGTTDSLHWQDRPTTVKYRTVKANLIVKRIDSATYIGNSSALGLIGRSVSFGSEKLNRGEAEIQRRLALLVPMIPFTVFHEAGLDLDKYTLVDRGASESVMRYVIAHDKKTGEDIKTPETVHFTGASLFSVDGHYYLFDIDRREIAEGVLNPFLAEIPTVVASIESAYNALKPAEVAEAEAQGIKVLRQGEWFFIPVPGEYSADENARYRASESESRYNMRYTEGVLRAGQNRPNHVTRYNAANSLFSGIVTHSGREHAPLALNGWYRAVPNTATRSFTITGDID